MVRETNYGIISDVHTSSPKDVTGAIKTLKRKGVDRFILNGDLTGDQNKDLPSTSFLSYFLTDLGQSNIKAYVQPGSHEEREEYGPLLKSFSDKYSNIINISEPISFKEDDHHIAFIPGSDWIAGHVNDGYRLDTDNFNKVISDPEKTIVFSHIPRKFDNIDEAVDMAYFGESSNGSIMPGMIIEKHIKQQFGDVPLDKLMSIAQHNGFILKKENRGNEELKQLYNQIGVSKSINGHFHESSQRANDLNGNHVEQGNYVSDLFWNASYLDKGRVGILTVKDNKVKYKNINL